VKILIMVGILLVMSVGWAKVTFTENQKIMIIQEGESSYGYELREIKTKAGTHYLLARKIQGKENHRRFITPKYYSVIRKELESLAKSYPQRQIQQRCEPEYVVTIDTKGKSIQRGRLCLAQAGAKKREKIRTLITDLERQLF